MLKQIEIDYGGGTVTTTCNRWDVSNYTVVTEFTMTKSEYDTVRNNITPGAAGELFKVLGRPYYYDKTWNDENTLSFTPVSGTGLANTKGTTTIYVRSISMEPVSANNTYLDVKIEGFISGSLAQS